MINDLNHNTPQHFGGMQAEKASKKVRGVSSRSIAVYGSSSGIKITNSYYAPQCGELRRSNVSSFAASRATSYPDIVKSFISTTY